jgi:hypothetical protein
MYRHESASWRFEQDNTQFLQLALFVRDAVQLPVAKSTAIPPRLAGEVPDHAAAVGSGERDAAAEQWAAWWDRLLAQAAREARRPRAQAQDTDPLAGLDVTGSWSYLAGPGCALCSAAMAADPPAAGRLLHDVFSSSRPR